uniref:Uncharacterized protein n=1 Tax=Arundo donax TaxID=35708 RepID=A0A0A9DUY5_ARUDO
MCSAFAGVIFTHFPWNHRSQMSHPIQNSFELYRPLQVPQRVLLCSSSSSYTSSTTAGLEFFVCPSFARFVVCLDLPLLLAPDLFSLCFRSTIVSYTEGCSFIKLNNRFLDKKVTHKCTKRVRFN